MVFMGKTKALILKDLGFASWDLARGALLCFFGGCLFVHRPDCALQGPPGGSVGRSCGRCSPLRAHSALYPSLRTLSLPPFGGEVYRFG